MHVEIRDVDAQGKDRVIGILRLEEDKIVAESSDAELMQAILGEPIYDPNSNAVYTAEDTPEEFLRELPFQYRSAYLRANLVEKQQAVVICGRVRRTRIQPKSKGGIMSGQTDGIVSFDGDTLVINVPEGYTKVRVRGGTGGYAELAFDPPAPQPSGNPYSDLPLSASEPEKTSEFDEVTLNAKKIVAQIKTADEYFGAGQDTCPQGHHLKDGPCRRDYCRCDCSRCTVQCREGK